MSVRWGGAPFVVDREHIEELRSPTVGAMRHSGLRDDHIEALLAELWNRGVTVTHGRQQTHVEWHAGTAVLGSAGAGSAEAAGDGS